MAGTGLAGLVGTAPIVTIAPTEQRKYEMMWEHPEYRIVAPGETAAQAFLSVAKPRPGSEVIDFGCGTGRGALMLALLGQMQVTMLDFADNCLDLEIRDALTTQAHVLKYVNCNMSKKIDVAAKYGFCCDVMEHIPPQVLDTTLNNILMAAQHVFFQISFEDDHCGKLIGHPLHMTVKPYAWWLERFKERDCLIHFSQDFGSHGMFYVTAWRGGKEVVDIGVLNVGEEQILKNVEANVSAGWNQVIPHPTNDIEVMILGGAPSLVDQLDTIRQLRASGVKLVTLNGAYNWAIDNGLTPSATVVVDARPFNARFTHPVIQDTKYLIASQCDPSVLDGLPHDRTLLWHTSFDQIRPILLKHYKASYPVPGGSTVLLRAIPLLRMLGFRRFHLFGCDSCLPFNRPHKHHAYVQSENDTEHVFNVVVGDRTFAAHSWMVAQAQEFMDLIRFLGDEIELAIYGDGLLSHILRTGAELSQE